MKFFFEISNAPKPGQSAALIAPLDWGLGHAARCIPIIRQLQEQGYKIIIAGSGSSLELLKNEIPESIFEKIGTRPVFYAKKIPLILKLILQIPKLIKNRNIEKQTAQKLSEKHKPDIIISDNRYGFRTKHRQSIFITHQISPKMPKGLTFLRALTRKIHLRMIRHFDNCLIPDFPEPPGLSGSLSHGFHLPGKFKFIGPLSRFDSDKQSPTAEANYYAQIVIIISGPEPSRTHFFRALTKQAEQLNKPILIISGQPGNISPENPSRPSQVRIVNHLNSREMQQVIKQAEYVICGAGYSSVMDLFVLQKKAMLVPTPGQTEQEYLAHHLSEGQLFKTMPRHNFSLKKADKLMQTFEPDFLKYQNKK